MDANVLLIGMGGLVLLNTVLGFTIIKLKQKIYKLEDMLNKKEGN